MIPNINYRDPTRLRAELEHIFRGGWQFAAMSGELTENRDFVRLDFPDDAIVIQNFRGQLRAFQNICTHRLNLIQKAERGNRPLTCAYHGWTFDMDGKLLGQDKLSDFLEAGESSERLCLTRYRVDSCGKFIFIARNPEVPSLDDFLGPFAPLLLELSGHIGGETYFGGVVHRANWKLLVENVLECCHCETVHPNSFVRALGVGRAQITDIQIAEITSGAVHSSGHFPRTPIARESLRRKMMSHLDDRDFVHDSFFHVHIFPNLFISSIEGAHFYVGQALPRAADETLLRVRFFEPAVELTDRARSRQDVLNDESVRMGLQVIEEDRVILESVHCGIAVTDRLPRFGKEEGRLAAFHKGYFRTMAPR